MLFTIGSIILVGIISQWIAWKQKIPVIILLILSGFVLGPLLGVITPQQYLGQEMIFAIVELSVALILFDGALQLKVSELKLVSSGLKRILSLGVVFHFLLICLAAKFLMDVSWGISALLAGILIVTGPTVIIPALREAQMSRRISHFFKWEGILTDPVGAIIAVVIYDTMILSSQNEASHAFFAIIKILFISLVASFGSRAIVHFSIRKELLPEYLQIPFVTSLVLISFVFSNHIQHGSGLLTVTLFGFLLGNSKLELVFNLRTFKENVTTMSISFVFITITASIPLSVFSNIGWPQFIFIFLTSFCLRPLAIFIATIKSNMDLKERLLIGLYGPRGIVAASVAAVLSSEMLQFEIGGGELFLPIVFLVILTTVIIHGIMLKPIAKLLGQQGNDSNGVIFIGTMPWVSDLALKLNNLGVPVMITSASWYKLAPFRKLGLNCFYGQILDHLNSETLDLNDYSFLMAMSENDSFNLLACERFAKHLGHNNVYHLKQSRNFIHDTYNIDKNSYCIFVNDLKLRYENIMRYYQNGWSFKDTKITEEYSYQDFLNDNDQAILFMKISENGKMVFDLARDNNKVETGDILISFAPQYIDKTIAA